jgi:murein L,D-transpeptidase YcbB/YkuD
VRVQHPFELADLILRTDENEYNIDSVNVYVKNRKQKKISLNNKLPVYIQYFTCGTDTNNNIVFYKDIYGLDKKLEELMQLNHQSNPVNIPELVSK